MQRAVQELRLDGQRLVGEVVEQAAHAGEAATWTAASAGLEAISGASKLARAAREALAVT